MRSWCQPDHQDAGLIITESRHRLSPILAVVVSPTFFGGDLLAMRYESATARATDHFIV